MKLWVQIPTYFLRKQKLRDFFYMTFQGVTVLKKSVLSEEKHFNTFNRHLQYLQDQLVGVESQSGSPSLDSSPLKPFQVAGRSTQCRMSRRSFSASLIVFAVTPPPPHTHTHTSAETTVALQFCYSLLPPLSFEDARTRGDGYGHTCKKMQPRGGGGFSFFYFASK